MEKLLHESLNGIFNGSYTIANPVSGDHRTFDVSTVKKGGLKGARIVSLMTGTDNTSDFTGFGFLKADGIVIFKKYRGLDGQPSTFEKLGKLLFVMLTKTENGYTAKGLTIEAEKNCIRCNRKLTSPASLQTGIGPECIKKM